MVDLFHVGEPEIRLAPERSCWASVQLGCVLDADRTGFWGGLLIRKRNGRLALCGPAP